MSDKPENFVITAHADKKVVERHFKFTNGDFISYRRTVGGIKGNNETTINDLHLASADLVIRHLLELLPEDYRPDHPYQPGKKK